MCFETASRICAASDHAIMAACSLSGNAQEISIAMI
jgi:hypothetical protein